MSVWAGSIFQVLTAIASGQVVDDAMIPRWVPPIAGPKIAGSRSQLGQEVPRHVEDDLGGGPESRGDVGGGQGPPGAEGHRHPVGPVVTEGEVEGRARRVVHRDGAEVE